MSLHFSSTLQPGPTLDSLTHIIDEWNLEHPDIHVALDTSQHDYDTSLPLEKRPDFVLMPHAMVKSIYSKNEEIIRPIECILQRARKDHISQVIRHTFSKTFNALSSTLLALPLEVSCDVIYTNTTLLKKIGIDKNYIPKNIQDMTAIANMMKEKGLVRYVYTCPKPVVYLFEIPLAQQNLSMTDPDDMDASDTAFRVSSEPAVKEQLYDIRRQVEENIVPDIYNSSSNAETLFLEGQVPFYLQKSSYYEQIQEKIQQQGSSKSFELGCGPLPLLARNYVGEKYAAPLSGMSICVMETAQLSERIEEVKAFINYLASKKTQKKWHIETAHVPISDEVVEELEEAFYQSHPLHNTVIEQTTKTRAGISSYGVHTTNYLEAEDALADIVCSVANPSISFEKITPMLLRFEKQFSTSQKSSL